MERFRYGPGAFELDYALAGPIPWRARECARAGTVHLGGTLEEIAAAELQAWQGQHPEWPFVILAQPSLFDDGRAPAGRHTAWVYCHAPHGSRQDMADESKPRSSASPQASRSGCWRAAPRARQSWKLTIPTISAAISMAASRTCSSYSPAPVTALSSGGCIFVPHQLRQAAASTVCAATMPPGWHWRIWRHD